MNVGVDVESWITFHERMLHFRGTLWWMKSGGERKVSTGLEQFVRSFISVYSLTMEEIQSDEEETR